MLHSGRLGQFLIASRFGNFTIYKMDVWNAWDDLALFKGLYRRPNEDNITFRNRIISAVNYNASHKGMMDWLCDSLDVTRFEVQDKKIFFSKYAPLSYIQYLKIPEPTVAYFSPEVVIGGVTYKFPNDHTDISLTPIEFDGYDEYGIGLKYSYSYEKTVIYDVTKTKSWTLWKNIDQSYFPIWEGNEAPADIKLRYQVVIDDELFIIEESSKRLTRDVLGNIIEETVNE